MSVTRELSEFALGIRYDDIPAHVTHEMKRFFIDALACAIGAFDAEPCRICRDVARENSGRPDATLIGETTKVSLSSAIIANGAMVRYLDFNDGYHFPKSPGKIGGGHPSDCLPAVFAVAERQHASGKAAIEAAVSGYEIMGRMVDAFAEGLTPMGFHHGSVMPFLGAAIAGRLLGLSAAQMTNAMGIGASSSLGLGINDAEGEEYNNSKNVADSFMLERGVYGALLAARGFTGPERVVEGNKGFAYCLLRGVENYRPKPVPNDYYLMRTRMKYFPTESTNQGHLFATGALVREHDLKPHDIESVLLRLSKRTVNHNGDPAKKYPRNKETADHSAYFITALGIVLRGKLIPTSFTPESYDDPVIRELSDRVTLEHGPEFDQVLTGASVTIRTKDGRVLQKRVDFPRGNPENRMSDAELRDKFVECAGARLQAAQIDRIIETCMGIEKLADFGDLMGQLAVAN
ncbi:MAG: MmgE/PrpD family protein [Xanthobacteraceae bacterium]|jgi:2-methylcitrate dehydratase